MGYLKSCTPVSTCCRPRIGLQHYSSFGCINIEFVAIDRSKKCLKSCIPISTCCSPRLGLQHCSGFVRQCVDAAFVFVWVVIVKEFGAQQRYCQLFFLRKPAGEHCSKKQRCKSLTRTTAQIFRTLSAQPK